MAYKLVGQEPYQLPSNADLGTLAYQNADAINAGQVLIQNTASVSGLVAALTVAQTQAIAGTYLLMQQVPNNLAVGQVVSATNVSSTATIASFVAGYAQAQPTFTATTLTNVVAMTSTFGIVAGYGVYGTGLGYGYAVSSVSNSGTPVAYSVTTATLSGGTTLYVGTTTGIAVNSMVLGINVDTGTLVTSVGTNAFVVVNKAILGDVNVSNLLTFAPTITLNANIAANTQTQNILFYPTITLTTTSNAVVTQNTVLNAYYNSTSPSSAAFTVQNGGLGVTGQSWFGSSATIAVSAVSGSTQGSHLTLSNPSGNQTTIGFTFASVPKASFRIDNNGGIILNSTNANFYYNGDITNNNTLNFWNNTYQQYSQIVGTTATFLGTLIANAGTQATTTNTGALQVRGGVGIGGNMIVGSTVAINTTTYTGNAALNVTTATNGAALYLQSLAGGGGAYVDLQMSAYNASAWSVAPPMSIRAIDAGNFGAHFTVRNKTGGLSSSSDVENFRVSATGTTYVYATQQSISSSTGALVVSGGAGFGGDVWINGTVSIAPSATTTNALNLNNNNLYGANAVILADPGPDGFYSWNGNFKLWEGPDDLVGNVAGNLQFVYNSTNRILTVSTSGQITIPTAIVSASTTTGALVVAGGAGIGGNAWIGGSALVLGGNIDLRNSTTASIVMASLQQQGNTTIFEFGRTDIPNTPGIDFHSAGSGTDYDVRIQATGGSSTSTGLGTLLLQAGQVSITSSTVSTNPTSGALVVSGGIGVGNNIYAGGFIDAATGFYSRADISVLNLAQSGWVTVISRNAGSPIVTSYASTITGATVSTNTTTGALVVAGGVGIGGALNVLSTATIGNGSAGTINLGDGSFTKSVGSAWTFNGGVSSGYVYATGAGGFQAVAGTAAGPAFQLLGTGGLGLYFPSTNSMAVTVNSTATTVFNQSNVNIVPTTNSTNTASGALTVQGGVGIVKDVWIGGAVNVASTSYIGGSRILVAGDLATVVTTATFITNDPTSQVGLVAIAGTSTVYGTYNFGDANSIATFNDYNTATNANFYSINDAATTPGYVAYMGFSNVTKFTRFVLNINYTASSGHTVEIDLYNFQTSGWDSLTTYSGSPGWFQFILEVIDSTPYVSGGKTYTRIYHSSTGNPAHRTWIDYAVLQDSIQGGQGPRGATGATGAQGPQGLTTSTTSTFIFFNTQNASSTNTAAVVVQGGLGIWQDTYIGGSLNVAGTINATVTGVISTATNLQGGAAGSIPYQTAQGRTGFIGIGPNNAVLTSNGSTATWQTSLNVSVTTATNATFANITDDPTNATPQYLTFASANSGYTGLKTDATGIQFTPNTNLLSVGNLFLSGQSASTSTTSSNALYVAGGSYLNSLYVPNAAVFSGPVYFNGTATYVYSTQTAYTDNILELHVPPTGVGGQWTVDDTRDIGFRFHYYTGVADTNAALVLANDTKYLEWYSAGAEGTSTFAGSSYGTFKTGNIRLAGGNVATTTSSGDLIVAGGIGVAGAAWAGNVIAVNTMSNGQNSANFIARPSGGVVSQKTGMTFYGTFFNFPGDTSPRRTADIISGFATGTWGNEYLSFNVGNNTVPNDAAVITTEQMRITTASIIINNGLATQAVSTTTGALIVNGGIASSGNMYVSGSTAGDGGTSNGTGSLVYIKQNTTWTGNQPWALYVSGYSYLNGFRINGFDGQRSLFAANSQIGFATGDTSSPITFTTQNTVERVRIDTTGTVYIGTTTQYSGEKFAVNGGAYINGTLTATNLVANSGASINGTLTATSVSINGSTQATSTTTGALTIAGGVGIGGAIWVGGYGAFAGSYNESTTIPGVYAGIAGSGTPTSRIGFFNGTASQNWQIDNQSGNFRWYTPGVNRMQLDASGNLAVYTGTNATSTTTGALVVTGGAGFGADVFVGGNLNVLTNGTGAPSLVFARYNGLNEQQIVSTGTANLAFVASGGGDFRFYTGPNSTEKQVQITRIANAVNYLTLTGSATGDTAGTRIISAGFDYAVPMFLATKNYGQMQFTKGRDATTASQFLFATVGGLTTDAGGGAFWRGRHDSSPNLTIGGANSFPRMGYMFETDSLTDPTVRNYYMALGNTTATYALIISNNSGVPGGGQGYGSIDFKASASATNDLTFRVQPTLTNTNYLQVNGAVSGSAPSILSTGTDANVNFNIVTKGASSVVISNTTTSLTTTTGALVVAGGVGIGGTLWASSGSSGGIRTAFGQIYDDGNLHVHGLTGNLWLNAVSGNVAINNQANGNVVMTNGTGNVQIVSTQNATSTSTGALQVPYGGVSMGGNLIVGGAGNASTLTNIRLAGVLNTFTFVSPNGAGYNVVTNNAALLLPSTNFGFYTVDSVGNARNFLSKDATQNINLGAAQTSIINSVNIAAGNAGSVNIQAGVTQNIWLAVSSTGTVAISSNSNSISTVTGALTVAGGVGIGGAAYIQGNVAIGSSATTAGSLLTVGPTNGVVSKMLTVSDMTTPANSAGANGILVSMEGGGGIYMSSGATGGNVRAKYEAYGASLGVGTMSAHPVYITSGDATRISVATNGVVAITSSTNATSTTSGALQVAGGVGIGGNAYVGGTMVIGTATNVPSSVALWINSPPTLPAGNYAPRIVLEDDYGYVTGMDMQINFPGIGLSTSTIAFDYYGNQFGGTSTPAAGPGRGQGSWGMNYISGRGNFSNHWFRDFNYNVQASIVNNGTFVTGYNYQFYTAPSYSGLFQGNVGVGTSVTNATLTVAGGQTITGIFTSTNATNATSTITGALQIVNGGIGVGGDIWAGNMVTGPNQYIYFGGITGTRIYRDGGLNGMSLQTSNVSRVFVSDTGTVTINSGTTAISTTTGALVVAGGAGFGGTVYAGGINAAGTIIANNGINATGTSTFKSTVTFVSPVSSASIVARMLDSDVLTFSGARGQLFSISDSFTGTIFGVYDVSGVPAIEAYDTGNVILAETFGNVGVGTTATTAKLTVNGGVQISGIVTGTSSAIFSSDVNSGGKFIVNNYNVDQIWMNSPGTYWGAIGNYGSSQTWGLGWSGGNKALIWNTGSVVTILGGNQSVSTGTGALVVNGGVGIANQLNVGGAVGIGTGTPGGKVEINAGSIGATTFEMLRLKTQDITQNSTSTVSFYNGSQLATQLISTWDTNTSGSGRFGIWVNDGRGSLTGAVVFEARTAGATNGGYVRLLSNSGAVALNVDQNQVVTITTGTNSSNTNTGALVVQGGVGIWNNLWVGGSINVAGTINASVTGVITTATNIAGGTAGQMPFQASPGVTNFTSTLTVTGNVIRINSGVQSTNTGTGALVVTGGVGISGALNATTKSFNIGHPTKPGMQLRYGSLEGPEFGVYVRGKLTDGNKIVLPDYWSKLVDPDTITVDITPLGKYQKLFVKEVVGAEYIVIGNDALLSNAVSCYYTVYAERADVDKLEVES